MELNDNVIWDIIGHYFNDNPNCLVAHHLDSYNDFFKNGIYQIFKDKNPIRLNSNYDNDIDDYRNQCMIYFGGKEGNKIYFGKPVIYDENNDTIHYMYPNEARLRNMTYCMTIHYDIDVEFIDILKDGEEMTTGGFGGETEEENDEDEYKFEDVKKQVQEIMDEKTGGAPRKVAVKKVEKNVEITPNEAKKIIEEKESTMIDKNIRKRTIQFKKVFLGKIPIMVQSDFCILKGLSPEIRHSMGECTEDIGGYFIIQGKEKTVICQEKFADNMLYIRENIKEENKEDIEEGKDSSEIKVEYLYSAEIRSVSENVSKPIRTLAVKIRNSTSKYTNKNIVVNIPNVRSPVPLFIVFRALGIETDKDIIEMCLLDMKKYESMVDLFIPSVHDAGPIITQTQAIEYIALLTKTKKNENVLEILSDYFLPHVGEVNFTEKAYYLGYIVFRLLSVYTGIELPTDRDNFKYKRIELVGSLLNDLFREYLSIQQNYIRIEYDKRLTLNKKTFGNDLVSLITNYQQEIFSERLLETGIKKAFKGNWGATANTKRIGVVQDLNRLSFNTYLSHLRKTNLPLDSTAKIVGPRVLHTSQWGFIDPVDTPDGANIGLHKSLAITTYVSQGGIGKREPMIQWMREKISMKFVEECSPLMLSEMTKIIINGYWAGSIYDPYECVNKIRLYRRNSLIPIFTSVTFEIKMNTIFIYTDGGRLCRPIIYRDFETKKLSFQNKEIMEILEKMDYTWKDLVTGFNKKKINYDLNNKKIYELKELYELTPNEKANEPSMIERFNKNKAIFDYIDCSESENALIAINQEEYKNEKKNYTHLEIHESLIFGNMCNLISFPENNQFPRNAFSCGQSKQAVSIYHTNHQVRMDKTAVVLNNSQIPLVKTRYLEYINHERNPYGENAIVAIMCYTGYNVEDAILINEGALIRGLFNTTYYSTYETHEEMVKKADSINETKFKNIENISDIRGKKAGYDYSNLDSYGIVKQGTEINDHTVLIGVVNSFGSKDKITNIDNSKTPKKGQLGIVDRTFITEGEEGTRIGKVRVREVRIPNLGDKFASRCGQKGTVGLVIPERDMPFTRDGLRPDIIINPHAIPSRMTIGQLIECLIGKSCLELGGFGDCTAFVNKGSKVRYFGELLTRNNYHSSGNQVLYNGMTGEQIESEIFIGPTYYMRLKHMVKDKINYRARGPNTALTRQPVSGRANDGGLRIGEMERDSVISHGIVNFLTESMMERSDKYYVAICNTTGMMAIYNPEKNIFFSPSADGPVKYIGSLDGTDMNIEHITKFGRDFSVICVPYSLKLLIQELQTINIQMRIITEDNIQYLENMTFSKNIEKLTGLSKMDYSEYKNLVKRGYDENKEKDIEIENNKDEQKIDTPRYQIPENGPEYDPNKIYAKTPEYSQASPAFIPDYEKEEYQFLQKTTDSPEYNPATPLPEGVPQGAKLLSKNERGADYYYDGYLYEYRISTGRVRKLRTKKGGGEGEQYEVENPHIVESNEFEEGEQVYIRGDGPGSNVLWNIKSVGDNFITLTTEDPSVEEKIKVVNKNRLLRPSDIVYDNRFDQQLLSEQSQIPSQYNPYLENIQQLPTQTQKPQIDFHPIINLISGDNKGVISGETKEEETPNTIVQKEHIDKNVEKQSSEEEVSNDNIDLNKQKSGFIDFSKLVIKKV